MSALKASGIPTPAVPKIKICGLRRREDIDFANCLRPDYIGFVFAKKSRRYVAPEQARELYSALDHGIRAVGVFVNEPLRSLEQQLTQPMLDIIQLHGTEDPAYLSSLRSFTDLPVIQAFSLQTAADAKRALASRADYILLDGKTAGSGAVFDWRLLAGIDRPYFLAGGLNPQNILEALKQTNPYAIDVSSGVETDGFKDFNKMRDLIRLVRNGEGHAS